MDEVRGGVCKERQGTPDTEKRATNRRPRKIANGKQGLILRGGVRQLLLRHDLRDISGLGDAEEDRQRPRDEHHHVQLRQRHPLRDQCQWHATKRRRSTEIACPPQRNM